MNELIADVIDQMEQIYQGNGWIGVNFKKKVDGLSDTEFFLQTKDMHSIAEIVSHLTTWRLETILKVKTGKGSITDDDPSNWKSIAVLKQQGKQEILLKHYESLLNLLNLLRQKNDSFLNEKYYDTDFQGHYPYSFLVQGMLHHDIYHLGQIGLLVKFLRSDSDK